MGNCTNPENGQENSMSDMMNNFTLKKDTKLKGLASDYQSELSQSLALRVQLLTKVKFKGKYQIFYKITYDRSYKKEWKEDVKGNIHRSFPQELDYNFGLLN
jgi:hypothetical protein